MMCENQTTLQGLMHPTLSLCNISTLLHAQINIFVVCGIWDVSFPPPGFLDIALNGYPISWSLSYRVV